MSIDEDKISFEMKEKIVEKLTDKDALKKCPRCNKADISGLQILGWSPGTDIEEGILKMAKHDIAENIHFVRDYRKV